MSEISGVLLGLSRANIPEATSRQQPRFENEMIADRLVRALSRRSGAGCRYNGRHVSGRVFGAWRSLVAHLLWEQRVGGSNPSAPTILD